MLNTASITIMLSIITKTILLDVTECCLSVICACSRPNWLDLPVRVRSDGHVALSQCEQTRYASVPSQVNRITKYNQSWFWLWGGAAHPKNINLQTRTKSAQINFSPTVVRMAPRVRLPRVTQGLGH